ncbi:efflux transporter outer membrane subunit [Uliginosibacterium sp. 31-16]|uniref:efflux transporter outer membrane subunit n=1 Tax=Uliginosibacterium sp. 31-16 TaxID=3068315 RepID=UPI00273DE2C6|nr:efflux transporter outer membrane subunit [Uliginosibacterium sp. 31-16]MDP5238405.1 efflux transporter outer membrane subunit [Uliginosibacterium sp. 31-16]
MFSRIAPRSRSGALCFTLLLCGCKAFGPDYKAPQLSTHDVPARWTSPIDAPGAATTASTAPATQWWSELGDATLDRLVAEAFNNSPTLEAALARLNESRALHSEARSAALPGADAEAGTRRSSSDDSGPGNQRWLGLNSSWELDLFGAVRRGEEGAAAREEAKRATLADARVSLAADVADAYLSYRACQSNLALSEQDVASREATRKLTADSIEVGFTAPYQGIRSAASVAEARTRLAETRAQCQQLENLITRLTGILRPALAQVLAVRPTGLDRLPEPKRFDIAVPTQAVLQRPDVRFAERSLAAASADIGLAVADRFPRLALAGSLGYSTSGSNSAGYLSFGSWSFGPTISLPVFDAGRRAAAVKAAESRYDETLATYKAKARDAIQEIENALTRYAAANERADNARVAASQYQHFFEAVEQRYREGASNLLELEDARRTMLDARQTLLGVQKERLQAWITLNRATGGAAQYAPEPTPGTPAKPPASQPVSS